MKTTRCLGEWFFLVLGCLDDLGQPETQYPMERRRLADILATSHALLNTLFDDEPLPFHFTFSGCLLCEIQRQPETLGLRQRKKVGMAAIRHVLFQAAQMVEAV